jgi:hypothetical protein
MQTTFDKDERFTSSIVLDIETLKLWDRWPAKATTYLSTACSHVRLLEVITTYHDQVEKFYSWLGERMAQVHAVAFKEVAELQEQYQIIKGQS